MRDEDLAHHAAAAASPPDRAKKVEEKVKARERSSITARVVHEAVLEEGEDELERTSSALAWSGLAAGLSMGFSFLADAILHEHLPPTTWRPLIATFGYTVGFVLVVIGRQQLYTENTLTAVLPVLKHRTRSVFGNMLRLWGVVLLANMIGAALFAVFLARSSAVEPPLHHALTQIAREALGTHDFLTMLVRAIPAGWLIALIVWLGPALPGGRLWIVIILAYVVGIAGFGHIIAGSIDVLYLVVRGDASVGDFFGRFFVPVLIGNTIGGAVLVAMLNHAQAMSGEE